MVVQLIASPNGGENYAENPLRKMADSRHEGHSQPRGEHSAHGRPSMAEERIARGIMGAGHSGPVAGRASIATGTVQGTTAAPRRRAAAWAPGETGSGGVSESGRFCQGAAGSRVGAAAC